MRKVLISFATLALLLAACGKGGGGAGGGPSSGGSASGGATKSAGSSCDNAQLNLFHPGRLTIGTDNPAYPPFFSGGTKKGSMWKVDDPNKGKGLESAIAYEVAKRLGFTHDQVEWVVAPFDQTYAPGSKSYDFAIEQISYTSQRAHAVAFSESYYDVNQALVAIKGTPITKAKSLADLKGYTLAAPIGTTSYSYITDVIKPTKEPGAYHTLSDTVAALNAHQVDGMLVDLPTALYVADPYVQEVKNSTVVGQFPNPKGGTTDHVGMVFQKGNSLVACVNKALQAMKSDGTLATIQKTWLSEKTNVGVVPVFKS